ncbi:3-isopropylmalate dehydratase [Variovorax sp. Root473]|uniref:LeuD/DmdB family oxidoreductase small subunit n=1 Tax=Variovorax sp. Root473 TaxID=1736541 RepID=UPI0006FE2433|nr:3-isopropylmalate dehydratase [Variovorax sp. Root473]KQX90479.1 3-isopropylmalate dehydratase [Variovorax sp. Root473]
MSVTRATHRVWRLGADIDTDLLAPGHAMKHGIDIIAKHCLEAIRPDFAVGVARGDVLVAGPNFGIGSSREQAAAVLVHLGVSAVIAPSYSGLYFRNAFNVGLLLLTCAEAESLSEGDQIALDTTAPEIVMPGCRRLACEPVPGFLMDMVRAGGLLNQLRQRTGRPASKKATDA